MVEKIKINKNIITREHAFRAWDKMVNEMIPWWRLRRIVYNQDHEDAPHCDNLGTHIDIFNDPDLILMQYIGIKDNSKNRIKVYENDFIIFDNSDIGGKMRVGEVIWNPDITLSNLEWGLWIHNSGFLPIDFLGKITIIGNKYETPDLLEKEYNNYA